MLTRVIVVWRSTLWDIYLRNILASIVSYVNQYMVLDTTVLPAKSDSDVMFYLHFTNVWREKGSL